MPAKPTTMDAAVLEEGVMMSVSTPLRPGDGLAP